jgi:hypothetical protein
LYKNGLRAGFDLDHFEGIKNGFTMNSYIFILFSLLCFSVFSHANDWPSWRGEDRSGVSKEKGLLQSWPEGGPKKIWSSDLPVFQSPKVGFTPWEHSEKKSDCWHLMPPPVKVFGP